MIKMIKQEREIIKKNVKNIDKDLLDLVKEGHLQYMNNCELVFNPKTKKIEGVSTFKYARQLGFVPILPYANYLSEISQEIIRAFYVDFQTIIEENLKEAMIKLQKRIRKAK